MPTQRKVNPYIQAMHVLERDGWCKGRYTDEIGAHCVMGAMGHALSAFPDEIRPASYFPAFEVRHGTVGPASFNDHPDTTYEDVLTLLAFGAAGAFK